MEDGWKIPLGRTPIDLHNRIRLRQVLESMTDDQIDSYTCPCNQCLVAAACQEHCIIIFRYMNYIADHLPEMTADEVFVYRHSVPVDISKYIEKMLRDNARLAHPNL